MSWALTKIRNFIRSEDGPTAVEYAVMLALHHYCLFGRHYSHWHPSLRDVQQRRCLDRRRELTKRSERGKRPARTTGRRVPHTAGSLDLPAPIERLPTERAAHRRAGARRGGARLEVVECQRAARGGKPSCCWSSSSASRESAMRQHETTDQSSGNTARTTTVGDGGSGQNAYDNVLGVVGVRITQVDQSKDALIQPTANTDPTAVFDLNRVVPARVFSPVGAPPWILSTELDDLIRHHPSLSEYRVETHRRLDSRPKEPPRHRTDPTNRCGQRDTRIGTDVRLHGGFARRGRVRRGFRSPGRAAFCCRGLGGRPTRTVGTPRIGLAVGSLGGLSNDKYANKSESCFLSKTVSIPSGIIDSLLTRVY